MGSRVHGEEAGFRKRVVINELTIEITPSPSAAGAPLPGVSLAAIGIPTDGTIISVGGPAYNLVSAVIEKELSPPAYSQGTGIVFRSGATSTDPAVGFLVKDRRMQQLGTLAKASDLAWPKGMEC